MEEQAIDLPKLPVKYPANAAAGPGYIPPPSPKWNDDDMRAYARAAVLADRERLRARLPELDDVAGGIAAAAFSANWDAEPAIKALLRRALG